MHHMADLWELGTNIHTHSHPSSQNHEWGERLRSEQEGEVVVRILLPCIFACESNVAVQLRNLNIVLVLLVFSILVASLHSLYYGRSIRHSSYVEHGVFMVTLFSPRTI